MIFFNPLREQLDSLCAQRTAMRAPGRVRRGALPGYGGALTALRRCLLLACALWLHTAFAEPTEGEQAGGGSAAPAADISIADSVAVERVTADDAIAARLRAILNATGWFASTQVRVDSGIVFLTGEAQDPEQVAWAGSLARNAQGVVAVVNNIAVATTSPWDLRPTYGQLQAMAAAAFRALPLALLALALLALTWLLANLTAYLTGRLLARRMRTPLLRDMVARASAALVFILGLYIVLRIAGLTSLAVTVVGGTGLLGLAIGFAFRDIAENFLASILISMQRPFAVGDFIEVHGHRGFVQRVNTRATLIMTRDGNHVQIPNAIIYKNEIINFTANPRQRQEFMVGISYDDAISEAQSVALQVLHEHPATLQDPEPLVLAHELASSSVNLRLIYWVDTRTYDPLKVRSAIIRRVKAAFDQAGISMPDDAREVIFPKGVPVDMRESIGSGALPHNPTAGATADDVNAHRAEGMLTSQDDDIEKQAQASRLPERGENLI
tara:strand:+ start:18852 stop:20345 length:1494 start_codon:yes stop_codon:yes gene_type:complete